MSKPLLAAVEIGGTKTIVAVGTGPNATLQQERLSTESPGETLGRVAAILKVARDFHGPITTLGIASFGPVDLRPASPSWGSLLSTPKTGWSGTPLTATLGAAANCPVNIDTDVNAAALGEWRWGAGRGVSNLAYVTVGTGVGGGLLLDGVLRHGLLHPELGHLKLRRHPDDDFLGLCPFHGDCLEGLISGPAIAARLSGPLDRQPGNHPFHPIFTAYLGQLCAAILLVASTERIIIGGGVVARLRPHAAIGDAMRHELAGYCVSEALHADCFIVAPELPDSGLAGAFALAEQLAQRG